MEFLKKFFPQKKETVDPTQESLYISLHLEYDGNRVSQFFRGPEITKERLKAIQRKFAQDFILSYADEHPGTKLRIEDLDIKMKIYGPEDGEKSVVDQIN